MVVTLQMGGIDVPRRRHEPSMLRWLFGQTSTSIFLLLLAVVGTSDAQAQICLAQAKFHSSEPASFGLNSMHFQRDNAFMGLFSTRDIADLTQMATELAAQTMQSNGELLAKPGRPEVKPLSLDARPSELLGQSLTNMMTPATQQLAQALRFPYQPQSQPQSSVAGGEQPELMSSALFSQSASTRRRGQPAIEIGEPTEEPVFGSLGTSANSKGYGGQSTASQQMNSILELANTFLGGGGRRYRSVAAARDEVNDEKGFSSGWGSGGLSPRASSRSPTPIMPSLKSLFSNYGGSGSGSGGSGGGSEGSGGGSDRNFGLPYGEGCLPFVGEFMRMLYGNCVRQADQRTWDAWGKEITNALMGGKIDLLRASKETCKKGAEREQCGQLRRAVSECDIIGSIQLASNMQRAISRCDEISGIMDQNPATMMQQMQGLINGEVAQGFLNNFLG